MLFATIRYIKGVRKMIKKGISAVVFCSCVVALFTGCIAAQQVADTQEASQGDRLTVGTVQKEIKKGMSGAEVAQALGSPNIVTTDEQGREVWIYDRISTEKAYFVGEGGGTLILLWAQQSAGRSSTSQQTLTVIIKFDNDKKVRDFAYHSSRF